jgi:hypothetical protein
VPSWDPELLARTHYALGTGVSTLDTMPDLYARWEAGPTTWQNPCYAGVSRGVSEGIRTPDIQDHNLAL